MELSFHSLYRRLVLSGGLSLQHCPSLNLSFDTCKMGIMRQKSQLGLLGGMSLLSPLSPALINTGAGAELTYGEEAKKDGCVVIGGTSERKSLDYEVATPPNLCETPDLSPLAT